MEAFVYCWTNHNNKKLYVGFHKGSLDDEYICSSKYMLEDYEKNPEHFTRQIIAEGSFEQMREFEKRILNAVNAKDDFMFYNRSNGNNIGGMIKHSAESKQNISKALTGKPKSNSHRAKLSFRAKHRTPEHNAKIAKSLTGRKLPEEQIEHYKKWRVGFKPNAGKTFSEEHKEKLRVSITGKKRSEETKAKMKEARLKYWQNKRANQNG